MKNLIALFLLLFAVSSCSLSDEPKSETFLLPLESVVMPDEYFVNQNVEIKIKYRRPTNCHIFDGFYSAINGNITTIGIYVIKLNQSNCQDDSDTVFEVPLIYKPTKTGLHIFKFWTGTDINGVDQYLTYEFDVL